jgi:hypothetical protein
MTRRKRPIIGEAEPIAAARKGKSLRDYADALKASDKQPYTHEVLNRLGDPFSLVKSEERAKFLADKINGSYRPFVLTNPAPSISIGDRYDH